MKKYQEDYKLTEAQQLLAAIGVNIGMLLIGHRSEPRRSHTKKGPGRRHLQGKLAPDVDETASGPVYKTAGELYDVDATVVQREDGVIEATNLKVLEEKFPAENNSGLTAQVDMQPYSLNIPGMKLKGMNHTHYEDQ